MTTKKEQDAINNVFGKATRVSASKKKKGKEEVEFNAPFDTLVNVAVVEKALEGVKEN